ncbi:hypothetical protein A616_28885 [Brevibacillus brevis X23]|nr:hypothetical protein A616_28885 [Brevibacillus brevis X23]
MNIFSFMLCLIKVYECIIADYHIGMTCEGKHKHPFQILQSVSWRRQGFYQEVRSVLRPNNANSLLIMVWKKRVRLSEWSMIGSLGKHRKRIPNRYARSIIEKVCLGDMSLITTREHLKRLQLLTA